MCVVLHVEIVVVIKKGYKMEVKIKKLKENAIIPKYQTAGAAGFDFHSAEEGSEYALGVKLENGVMLKPGEVKLISTGLSVEIPPGYELQVRPRSGLAIKNKITVLNSPGTVDSDYRGEIKIILYNAGDQPYLIAKGERIAQGVISPVIQAVFTEVDNLSNTERNSGGFGSTGR